MKIFRKIFVFPKEKAVKVITSGYEVEIAGNFAKTIIETISQTELEVLTKELLSFVGREV